ncbi:hypothetical protein [Desertivirga xinjiangensis]|uniref:hypothetical protein n=1 Tax=Desertivirga xinjiangensis TaxID=539206 RepID=UPI00210EEF78|nr:hypothetical protein [Pedobacter xinjiangensis]
MAIQKIQTSEALSLGNTTELNLMQKFNAFADAQEKISIVWWLLSLILIGGFFLPLTFLLVYSLGGPTAPFLAISMISFLPA